MISTLPMIFKSFPCTCTPQLIYPWSILNDPSLLLLSVDQFTSLTLYLLLPLTQYLVYFCCHLSSAIKSSPGCRTFSLHLHFTIYRHLINHQWPWFPDVYYQLISISDPDILLSPTGMVPGLLLLSLIFCYEIFLWFLNFALHLRSTTDIILINPQLPWISAVYCWFICIADNIFFACSYWPGP